MSAKTVKVAIIIFLLTLNVLLGKSQENSEAPEESSVPWTIIDDSTIYTIEGLSRTTLLANQPEATSPPPRKVCPESIYYDQTSNTNITFPETPPSFATTSNEICLCNGSQITRVCLDEGNWGEPSGSCCDLLETTQLYNDSFVPITRIPFDSTETEPPLADSPITDPPITDPPQITETPITEPQPTEPPPTESSQTKPPRPEPPQIEPPPKEPPQEEPPQTEPPQTEPPQTEPPQTKPPQTEPPQTEPPQIEPPQTEPPSTERSPSTSPSSTPCCTENSPEPTSTTDLNTTSKPTTPFPSLVLCPEEHYYDPISNRNLTFPETPIEVQVTSKEICLCHGKPILRMCSRDGTWNKPNGSCCDTKVPKITQDLNELLTNMADENLNTTVETIKNITKNHHTQLAPIDIHLMAKILDNARENEFVQAHPSDFFETVNNIMDVDQEVLSSSQRGLNSTDTILYSLDRMLLNSNIKNVFDNTNLVAFSVNSTELAGAMIRSTEGTTCNSFDVVYLNEDDYEDHLQNTNFEIAVLVPPDIANDRYFITLFCKETLFNQENKTEYGSWTVSILFAGDSHYTQKSQIKIFFKKTKDSLNHNCNYWKYGFDNRIPITGRWQNDSTAQEYGEDFYLCEVNHTTHFTILVGSVIENLVLDVITIFGSILSIIGIAIVFLSALLFKRWRKKVQNKILLNISACLLLLIILFQISDKIQKGPGCIVVGMMLHYFVIAQFCWTLVISYCNYHRIIKVTAKKPTHILAKYCTFAWGTPIIVVVIVAAINSNTYDKTGKKEPPEICYPKGIYQTLGLILPVSLILAINLSLFIFILIKLTGDNFEIRRHQTRKSYQIQKPIILMFFMMGLTWTFGILATFTQIFIFDCLFCLLATFQGFVVFIFYILDSKVINTEWRNLICGSRNKPTTRNEHSSIETIHPHSQQGLINS